MRSDLKVAPIEGNKQTAIASRHDEMLDEVSIITGSMRRQRRQRQAILGAWAKPTGVSVAERRLLREAARPGLYCAA